LGGKKGKRGEEDDVKGSAQSEVFYIEREPPAVAKLTTNRSRMHQREFAPLLRGEPRKVKGEQGGMAKKKKNSVLMQKKKTKK